jgi:hypothetical protein
MNPINPLLLLLLTALPTFARLGETKAECEARYGKPISIIAENNGAIYQKAGLTIVITFWKDKAARVSFSKDNPDHPGYEIDGRAPLTRVEQDTLLKANSGNSTWKKDEESDAKLVSWTRADDKAIAMYSADGNDLTFTDSAYADHLLKEMDKKEAKKLEGF